MVRKWNEVQARNQNNWLKIFHSPHTLSALHWGLSSHYNLRVIGRLHYTFFFLYKEKWTCKHLPRILQERLAEPAAEESTPSVFVLG